MVQKVRKCPKCGGAFLLWTGICLRCGRIAEVTPQAQAPTQIMDVRVIQVLEQLGAARANAANPFGPAPAPPAESLPIDDMFDTGKKTPEPKPAPAVNENAIYAERASAAEAAKRNAEEELERKYGPPRHFLVLGYKDAIELVPGKRVAIGRHASSNLRIDRPEISRQHAELEWQGEPPRPFLRDAGPGATYVNGRLIAQDPASGLNDGDEVALGRAGFKMSYRFTPVLSWDGGAKPVEPARPPTSARLPRLAPAEASATPSATTTRSIPRPPLSHAIEGDFAKNPADAVLEDLLSRNCSGVLRFTTNEGSGTIIFEQGKPKTVIFGTLTGHDAIEKIVALRQGTYRFQET